MITRLYNNTSDDYEVGKREVGSIELTDHGNEKRSIYKVIYEDESLLFVGLLEHEIECVETFEQTTIFDYLEGDL